VIIAILVMVKEMEKSDKEWWFSRTTSKEAVVKLSMTAVGNRRGSDQCKIVNACGKTKAF